MTANLMYTIIGCSLLGGCTLLTPSTLIQDDFENGSWSAQWQLERPFDYSIKIVPDPSAPTEHSLQFEWKKADWNGIRTTKGTEIKTTSFSGMPSHTLSFRIYFDESKIPESSKPVILMQYHSIPDLKAGEQWRHPITSLMYKDGELYYSYRNSQEVITPGTNGKWKYNDEGLIALGKPLNRKWNTIKLRQKFNLSDKKGSIEITINKKYFSAHNINLGYNDEKGPYLKIGIYCPQTSDYEKITATFDDIILINE